MNEKIEPTPKDHGLVTLKKMVNKDDPLILIDFIQHHTKLSKSLIKKVFDNGGVWLKKGLKGKTLRVRRAQTELHLDSFVEFYYRPQFYTEDFESKLKPIDCLFDGEHYGVFYKPQGIMSAGNEFGDFGSAQRQVEKFKNFNPKQNKKVHLIHRLDREASGIMLFAYHDKAAMKLSQLFQERQVIKRYRVLTLGQISKKYKNGTGKIQMKLDGKEAITLFSTVFENEKTTILDVEIKTGRLHQIRRHFDKIQFPLMGDPKYGRKNKNKSGLQLIAYHLEFMDPFTAKNVHYTLPDDKLIMVED